MHVSLENQEKKEPCENLHIDISISGAYSMARNKYLDITMDHKLKYTLSYFWSKEALKRKLVTFVSNKFRAELEMSIKKICRDSAIESNIVEE